MASELGVQTIQHTNGTDALTIDSGGRVNLPAIPCFSGQLTPSNTKDSSSPYTATGIIKYDNIIVNRGSCYSASTGLFTAPIAGIYFAIFHHLSHPTVTDTSITIKKGSTAIANGYASPDNEYVQIVAQTLIPLNANDTLNTNLDTGQLYLNGLHGIFTVKLVG